MKHKLTILLLFIGLHFYGNDLIVHEWGSINLIVGSDAKAQLGAISEDQSDLPNFVEVWSKQPVQRLMIKEKPIIYFYTKKDMLVNVTVNYPKGVFTQWWPKPDSFLPRRGQHVQSNNGMLFWRIGLKVDKSFDKNIPIVGNHPWWHIARDVDAVTVTSRDFSSEKFLFYL